MFPIHYPLITLETVGNLTQKLINFLGLQLADMFSVLCNVSIDSKDTNKERPLDEVKYKSHMYDEL
jgi:hypothetical protein